MLLWLPTKDCDMCLLNTRIVTNCISVLALDCSQKSNSTETHVVVVIVELPGYLGTSVCTQPFSKSTVSLYSCVIKYVCFFGILIYFLREI